MFVVPFKPEFLLNFFFIPFIFLSLCWQCCCCTSHLSTMVRHRASPIHLTSYFTLPSAKSLDAFCMIRAIGKLVIMTQTPQSSVYLKSKRRVAELIANILHVKPDLSYALPQNKFFRSEITQFAGKSVANIARGLVNKYSRYTENCWTWTRSIVKWILYDVHNLLSCPECINNRFCTYCLVILKPWNPLVFSL